MNQKSKHMNTKTITKAADYISDMMTDVEVLQNRLAENIRDNESAKQYCAYTGQDIIKFKAKLKLDNRKLKAKLKLSKSIIIKNIGVLFDGVQGL